MVHRGLATYQNLIIAPIIDGRLQALEADTGKVVWEARVAYPQDNYTVTMAPPARYPSNDWPVSLRIAARSSRRSNP